MNGDDVQGRPPLIDEGLPASREKWPPGVLSALVLFSQGDVVTNPPFFYFSDTRSPIWQRSHDYAKSSAGPEIVEMADGLEPAYGMITTQTCDIAEEDASCPIKPWVQIAPVHDRSGDLNSGQRRMLMEGRGSRHWLYLPALPDGFWVADLRIEFPIEKGWLARQAPIKGFVTEIDQRRVGERLAWQRRRPAFGQLFVETVQRPLVVALKELKQRDGDLYVRLDEQIPEVGVSLDSHLNPSDAQLTLIRRGPLDEDVTDWWQTWWDRTYQEAATKGLSLHRLQIRSEEEMTVAEYRRITPMPLLTISPD